ncbi:MAG TPA: tetratricopeptide repeat protein, partial [Armatimonadota bacterium]|nr:tetratricopeptide repeat protein [Armatimonadota bacterium]
MSEQPTTSRDEGARLLQAGDPEGATSLLQQAIMQNPSDGRAHGLLGICHARRGDLPASIASLSEAARLMPNEAAVHYNLANVLFQAHRLPEARAGLERALALKPDHPGALQLLERVTAASPATAAPAASSAPPGAFTAAPPTDFSSGLSAPSPEAAPASLGGPPQPWSSV